MVQMELSDPKAELLREVLVNYLSDLRMEIACSQQRELRDFLKKRGDQLEELLHELERKLTQKGRNIINIDRLRKVDVLLGLTDWELKVVAQFLREQTVPEGVTLFEEGQKADRLFILEEGEVSVRLPGGESYQVRSPGKIVGWSFLIPPNRYIATGRTVVASKLLVMQSPDFYYLIHKEPRMGVQVMGNLAQVLAGRLLQWAGRQD